MFYDYPIFFEKNRVFRVYQGGKLFADFFSDDSEDGNYQAFMRSMRAARTNTKAFPRSRERSFTSTMLLSSTAHRLSATGRISAF